MNKKSHHGADTEPKKAGLWFGLVFFGLCAVVLPDWSSSMALYGALIGVVLTLALCVFVAVNWNRRFTDKEVKQGRKIYPILLSLTGVFAFIGYLLSRAVEQSGEMKDLIYAAIGVLMTLGAVIALVIAYNRKGLLYQGLRDEK